MKIPFSARTSAARSTSSRLSTHSEIWCKRPLAPFTSRTPVDGTLGFKQIRGERSPDVRRHSTLGSTWSMLSVMKIATGKVVGGKVVIDGVFLEEGTSVTVLARDVENGFTLSPEEEAELLLPIAEADR